MRFILDTHVLLWAVGAPERLPNGAAVMLDEAENELIFSVVSIWEIAIKRSLNKPGFGTDPRIVRRALLASGYRELPITSEHAVGVMSLPTIHKDPFDRILIAQADSEGAILLTSDRAVSRYPGNIRML